MTIKRTFVLLAVVVLAIILPACELSASTPPPSTQTGEGPMGTLQSELGDIATQTALAGGGNISVPTTQAPSGSNETQVTTEPAQPTPSPTVQPPTDTPVTVFTATPGIPSTYTLQKGEFPFCIARRFNVNQYELLNINGLSLSSRPTVGFTLKIPQTGNHFVGQRALRSHPDTYTVSGGDTIYSIACMYGDVDPSAIAQRNELKAPYNLNAGKKLQIP